MAIPLDQYFSIAPETDVLATGYAHLAGSDLFFYVSTTHELRVVPFGSVFTNYVTLAIGVMYCDVVWLTNVAHVYYVDLNGAVWHFQYDQYGIVRHPITQVSGIPIANTTISVIYQPHTTPQVYVMMLDDGTTHWVITSLVPDFSVIATQLAVFHNAFDQNYFSFAPKIAVHPNDTVNLTVVVDQVILANSQRQVGFYVTQIPGVV